MKIKLSGASDLVLPTARTFGPDGCPPPSWKEYPSEPLLYSGLKLGCIVGSVTFTSDTVERAGNASRDAHGRIWTRRAASQARSQTLTEALCQQLSKLTVSPVRLSR